MAKRTIIFRADGGPTIGMGHFTRTLALAEMLNEQFHCVYVTQSPTEYQIQEIRKICHERIDLPKDNSHFERFLLMLHGDEIVVLDNYYFTTEYQKAIKAKGCKLVCIDDLHDKHYVADIVINHGINNPDYFSMETYTKIYLGLEYALIRPDFYNSVTRRIDKLETVFVCFGGSDPHNLTMKVLEIVLDSNLFKQINVIVGAVYSELSALESKIDRNPNVTLFSTINSNMLANLMKQSDLAIIPSSTVVLEAIYTGIPIISGYYVDNQKEFAESLGKLELIINCGNFLENSEDKLNHILSSLSVDNLNKMLQKQKNAINKRRNKFVEIFNAIF